MRTKDKMMKDPLVGEGQLVELTLKDGVGHTSDYTKHVYVLCNSNKKNLKGSGYIASKIHEDHDFITLYGMWNGEKDVFEESALTMYSFEAIEDYTIK
jgi:hypothetical protein